MPRPRERMPWPPKPESLILSFLGAGVGADGGLDGVRAEILGDSAGCDQGLAFGGGFGAPVTETAEGEDLFHFIRNPFGGLHGIQAHVRGAGGENSTKA
jgi:hypothetical protein